MNILYDVINTCTDVGLQHILSIVKRVLNFIGIIGPIICIVSLIIIFTKLVVNPEEKKNLKSIYISMIALVVTFLLPVVVSTVVGIVSGNSEFSRCWKNASDKINGNSTYIETDGRDKNNIFPDSDEYEKGEEGKREDNNNSNQETNTRASKIVFLGDSRTVQMYAYLNNDWSGANYSSGGAHEVGEDIFIAQGGKGLSWMKSTGVPASDKYLNNGTALVILMGVNDLGNINSYLEYVNSNISNWQSKGATVYFAEVMPCNGSYEHLNSKINNFNKTLKSNLPTQVKYLDLNKYLTEKGYRTTDGLHYDKETSKMIYNYIKSKV